MGRLGLTTPIMEPEFTDRYLNKVLAIHNEQRQSLDDVLARVRRTKRISARTKINFVDATRENTPCALHGTKNDFPFAPFDLVHQQRHVSHSGAVLILDDNE